LGISFFEFYNISSTRDRIFALPPDGIARTVLHSKHLTFVDAFPNIVCVVLHFEQMTFINFPLLSILLFSVSD